MRNKKVKIAVPLAAILLFWLFFLNHLSVGRIGVAYNASSGEVVVQERAGWYLTLPWVFVMRIDTRPIRVSVITLANVMVTKLVRFRKEGIVDFLERQGFAYMFPLRQRFIMVGYAFSGKEYSFLEILEDPTQPSPDRAP